MKLRIRPLGPRVVVEQVDARPDSKIILPTQHLENEHDHREGRVLRVGSGTLYPKAGLRIPIDVKVGDRVVFSKWAGSPMKIEGRDVIVMQMADVLAVREAA